MGNSLGTPGAAGKGFDIYTGWTVSNPPLVVVYLPDILLKLGDPLGISS